MTLEEFYAIITQFTAYLRDTKNYSIHTTRAYIADLEQCAKFWNMLQERSGKEIAFSSIIERYFSLLATKKNNKSTIARKISCFNTLERFAHCNGFHLNILVSRPYIAEKKPDYLSEQEIKHVLARSSEQNIPTKRPYRDQAIIEFFYSTGITCSELIEIRCGDILPLDEKKVLIKGKKNKSRVISFNDQVHKKLVDYLKERCPITHSQEYLFLNYRNEPLTTRSIQRICEMFSELVKSDTPITPHTLRHTCATHLAEKGANEQELQDQLGLSKVSVEKYIRLLSEKKKLCSKE
ncbi:MAG: tyrosine-type recombinase/integrase [Candidatus Babeliaceae bacterium]